ncbi:Zn(2)-C6 fungal-type domain-containing protein [Mycena indigotica]|uniref:Zn(2)-C6 fungal-type domain-containing protein n=1 Tax=Mycena indigotica TaxID=2126181 RepID=A0A8H6TES7_9AGAR|nr:Zn(2)-C6 fungal-type domain-containing protein [Mycena indigotica]KAF7315442.1 Zn(2)-C6 fungal-type domain-containing protein [Mycena indigotica]
MTDSMSYPSSTYLPQTSYYSTPPMHHHHGHQVSPPSRQEAAARKRPKYTRSKTGCLTCRVKKIKCDEAKPSCMRCAHGQRDCTWPDGVATTRKRASSVKDSPDTSTAPSSASPGISEASSPTSTRGHSPPQRSPVELSLPRDLNLPPLLSNRRQDPGYHLPPMHHHSPDIDSPRRDYDRRRYSPPAPMPMVHDVPQQQHYSRYEPFQTNGHIQMPPRHTLASSVRSTMGHHPSMQHHQWSPPPPPLMTPPEQYYQPERPLVSNDHMARYP